MAREIYEIKLKDRYIPALSAADALDTLTLGGERMALKAGEVEISLIVQEEHTMKLFLLAKTMYDLDKFEYQHIKTAIGALAREMGYDNNSEEIADCIITWTERFEDMTLSDLEEWVFG